MLWLRQRDAGSDMPRFTQLHTIVLQQEHPLRFQLLQYVAEVIQKLLGANQTLARAFHGNLDARYQQIPADLEGGMGRRCDEGLGMEAQTMKACALRLGSSSRRPFAPVLSLLQLGWSETGRWAPDRPLDTTEHQIRHLRSVLGEGGDSPSPKRGKQFPGNEHPLEHGANTSNDNRCM